MPTATRKDTIFINIMENFEKGVHLLDSRQAPATGRGLVTVANEMDEHTLYFTLR